MSGGGQGGAPAPGGAPTAPSGIAGNPYELNAPGQSYGPDSPYRAGAPNTGNMNRLPGFASGQAQQSRDPGNNFNPANVDWDQVNRNAFGYDPKEFQANSNPFIYDATQAGATPFNRGGRYAELQQIHQPKWQSMANAAAYDSQWGGPAQINRGDESYYFRGIGADGRPIYQSPSTGSSLDRQSWEQLTGANPEWGQTGYGGQLTGGYDPLGGQIGQATQSQTWRGQYQPPGASPMGMSSPSAAPTPAPIGSSNGSLYSSPNPYSAMGPLYGVL